MAIHFSDILYGRIEIPDWLSPFLTLPEFVRLRGVRLSNVDSFEYKDFNGPTRWEHSIGVAVLALRYAYRKGLSETDQIHLVLGALLHDVATPPFAHTVEYVLSDYDHEQEAINLLSASPSDVSDPGLAIFASQLPQFRTVCDQVSRARGVKIDPDKVAELVVGEGEYGSLINGTLDLDNADNVTRACLHIGIDVDKNTPFEIVDWLASLEHLPPNLYTVGVSSVRKWIQYRDALYSAFYNSSDEETGRQAFLQHLLRKALRNGLPRRTLVWNTDERLLIELEGLEYRNKVDSRSNLRELVEQYRLLRPVHKVAQIDIAEVEALEVLRTANAVDWMERALSTEYVDLFFLASTRRYAAESESLFPLSAGAIRIFKLGAPLTHQQLPNLLQERVPSQLKGPRLADRIGLEIRNLVFDWSEDRPWLDYTPEREESVISSLENVGNWSFRSSRNESLHAYPSTFVYAIPATLINCLGMQGAVVVDPFGGTGQTAIEAVKHGGAAVSADSNSVATMVAAARLSYMDEASRNVVRHIVAKTIWEAPQAAPPDVLDIARWHHPDTLLELCHIKGLVDAQECAVSRRFLATCLSAVIPNTTARRGKQHGFFADNTPLASGETAPPYQDAISLFLDRVRRNLDITERLYASIERRGRDPEVTLSRAAVVQVDARDAVAEDYGLKPNSADLIITSPPYLCMADYTLGQRLTYYWLFGDRMKSEFEREIAPRRARSSPERALQSYYSDMNRFATTVTRLLRPGGMIATVIAEPRAKAFQNKDILSRLDRIWSNRGLRQIWSRWRPILWHRNHGYSRLKQERVAVHVFEPPQDIAASD